MMALGTLRKLRDETVTRKAEWRRLLRIAPESRSDDDLEKLRGWVGDTLSDRAKDVLRVGALAKVMVLQRLSPGQILHAQHDRGEGFMLVIEGGFSQYEVIETTEEPEEDSGAVPEVEWRIADRAQLLIQIADLHREEVLSIKPKQQPAPPRSRGVLWPEYRQAKLAVHIAFRLKMSAMRAKYLVANCGSIGRANYVHPDRRSHSNAHIISPYSTSDRRTEHLKS